MQVLRQLWPQGASRSFAVFTSPPGVFDPSPAFPPALLPVPSGNCGDTAPT